MTGYQRKTLANEAEHGSGEVQDACRAALDRIAELEAACDKLQRFKTWTHNYLDTHGVPHHPPGTHGAEGCRIGDRMDWLMAELAKYRHLYESQWHPKHDGFKPTMQEKTP